jgi:hypothetical protein
MRSSRKKAQKAQKAQKRGEIEITDSRAKELADWGESGLLWRNCFAPFALFCG